LCSRLNIDFEHKDLQPLFQTVFEIPKPIGNQTSDQHKEYPCVLECDGGILAATDGSGLLYVLVEGAEGWRAKGLYQLPQDGSSMSPFKIHAVRPISSSNTIVCILSSRIANGSSPSRSFDLWTVSLPLVDNSNAPVPLNVLYHSIGKDVPMHCGFDEVRQAFYILGESVYKNVDAEPTQSYAPSADEIAPIPRAGENLADIPMKPPPYSWTQTSDSVTVAFPLPSNLPKKAIHVTFTSKSLSLLVTPELPTPIELPKYMTKPFWDGINPSSSYWTWDKEAEKRVGILSLHLDKQHEGTKWMHLFATAGTGTTDDPTDEEVPETLDPSELWHIRESLEKYTSALIDGEDASGLGLGNGVPTLAEGEMDDSVDASVGSNFQVTWIGVDGAKPSWAAEEREGQSVLLSTPIPGLRGKEESLVIKSDIDGLLFALPPPELPTPLDWVHTGTFPVLAFVLASKRDTRFVHHVSSKAVLAFESGSGFGSGNVYIYRSPVGKQSTAKQSVLKVSGGISGSLLGVGSISSQASGEEVLLCLCEKELVVARSYL